MPGKLVICPTPIGNLGDMPPRALEALRGADVVCAEDTRVTGKLLAALGVQGKRLERLDENLVAQRAQSVVDRVRAGEVVVYCTDAGMPGVSDPGQRLVKAARDADVAVEVLPGPTAVATAYVASGFTAPAFYFGGFFPRKDSARDEQLASLRALDAVLVFYESPNRIVGALESVARVLPHRSIAVCRELTKLHEEVLRGSAADVRDILAARDAVKGEIVLVVDAPGASERADEAEGARAAAEARARELVVAGERPKSIAKAIAAEFGIPRNVAYDLALSLKG